MTAPFPHRPKLLRLIRNVTHYRPLHPDNGPPLPHIRSPDDKEYISLPPDCGPRRVPLWSPIVRWRSLFGQLEELRAIALACGDHESVLLVDVVRILVNLQAGTKRDRFEFALDFLMGQLARDCGEPDGPNPC